MGHNVSNDDSLGEFSHLVSKLVSNQSVTWDNVVQELPAMVIKTFMDDSRRENSSFCTVLTRRRYH